MKYYLAPLAGFTDSPFRTLCMMHPCDGAYTEMVSAAGLLHGSVPTHYLMETLAQEPAVAVQIFGATPEEMAAAAREVTEISHRREDAGGRPFTEINLNAGCPMPRIRHDGAGADLVKYPERVASLLRTIKANTDLPMSLKTRLGPWPGDVKMFELLDAAEGEGCVKIIMHARFVRGIHSGPLFYDLLGELVQRAKIPVIGNGGVVDRATAEAMEKTGVAGVMVARGALANPWIFDELAGGGAEAKRLKERDWRETFLLHLELLEQYTAMLAEKYPQNYFHDTEGYVLNMVRTHLVRYTAGQPGAALMRKHIASLESVEGVREFVQSAHGERDERGK
ncbi:MAG: tRNA-dihydrouridine synthase family protein [Kiritimatiellae bacterium]|nr:tRNA-dihydrouridine synthase family protein [Kiritimatiellia bacterium]